MTTPAPISARVAYDLTVDEAEPIYDEPGPFSGDVCLEQWITGEVEPPDSTGREVIYVAPGQAPRLVHAMLEALRQVAPAEVHEAAIAALRKQAWTWAPKLTPSEVRLMARILVLTRELREAKGKAKAPKPTKKRRSNKARR